MSKITIFVQIQGEPGVRETELPQTSTLGDLQDALTKLGIKLDAETFIFIDEADEHEQGRRDERVHRLKHGCRVHVTRCKRIAVTVHFADKTAEHAFSPAVRVRAVKAWAVEKFEMSPKDAGE